MKIKITFDYLKGRRSIIVDTKNVSLWEISTCIEEQTKMKSQSGVKKK